ncbi:MAG: SDR family NAD(P)-dependent oxidoreductase [Lachnospiraceae bacterium]|nr:SDR family NAD(P)-dependent oxidoreductase [Lachnospiraceae bacterium]
MSKIAIVTGGSSGIGLNVAMCLKNAGCTVYELSRRDVPNSPFNHIATDVTDEVAVQAAVKRVLEKEEKIDILVNCAGFGISGAAEFTELADAKRQLDVNFFGMVNVTKAVLTPMRKAGGGRIVNISSVAAPIPIPFQTFYSASKAAINAYTCAVANEVAPYGITMCAIQPGDISSGFTDARKKSIEGDAEYGGRISRSVEVMEKDERGGMKPAVAAAYICKIALKKKVKPLYAIGFSYKAFCVIMKILPIGLSNKMIGMIYAK